MEICLDLVMVLNFLVDFLLLLGTNRLSGFPGAPGRCALGALVGGVYGGACLLPGFRFLGSYVWRLVFLCLMAGLAFGCSKSAVKRGGVFLLLSMAMGGAALCFGRGDFGTVMLVAVFVWLLCQASFGGSVGGREYVPVFLRYGENTASVLALRDTGNTLRDPITGEQVLVVSDGVARKLTGLTPEQLRTPLETLAKKPIPGLRLIPYRSVGHGSGMLLALRIREVKIGSRKQSALVAFAPEGLGGDSLVQALTGGVL